MNIKQVFITAYNIGYVDHANNCDHDPLGSPKIREAIDALNALQRERDEAVEKLQAIHDMSKKSCAHYYVKFGDQPRRRCSQCDKLEPMKVTGEMVRRFRELSGRGLVACRKALIESDGDFEKAKALLR